MKHDAERDQHRANGLEAKARELEAKVHKLQQAADSVTNSKEESLITAAMFEVLPRLLV